jgi:hypothetical protein
LDQVNPRFGSTVSAAISPDKDNPFGAADFRRHAQSAAI